MAKQKMRLTLRAFDHRLLDESVTKICATVKNSGTKYSGPILCRPKSANIQFFVHLS